MYWKKFTFSKSSYFSLSFSPSLASLYLFEQCLRLGVRGTSSVCLPLLDESLIVFPNCKSLWIKASAKWLNVNVNVLARWKMSLSGPTLYRRSVSRVKKWLYLFKQQDLYLPWQDFVQHQFIQLDRGGGVMRFYWQFERIQQDLVTSSF